MSHPRMLVLRKVGDRLIAPMRGKPPPCPEGYENIPGNKYTFWRKIPECLYRSSRVLKCCGKPIVLHCSYYNIDIIRQKCLTCEVEKCPVQNQET